MLKIKTAQPDMVDPTKIAEEPMVPFAPQVNTTALLERQPIPTTATPLPKSMVVYMSGKYGPFECANCCFFSAPDTCSVVAGSIDPLGCCNLYCPPNHDEPEDDLEAVEPAPVEEEDDMEPTLAIPEEPEAEELE